MSIAIRNRILSIEREQARAINAGNIPEATRMFDKSLVGFSSTRHERIQGLRALSRTFRHYLLRAPRMTYRISQTKVQVSGATAVATFYWTVGLSRNRTVRGRGTHVFAKRGKDWRVIHEHFSRAH